MLSKEKMISEDINRDNLWAKSIKDGQVPNMKRDVAVKGESSIKYISVNQRRAIFGGDYGRNK